MPLHFPGWMRAHRSLLSGIALLVSIAFNPQQALADELDFERDVAPILIQNCLECHSALDPSGGLNLTRSESFRKGGDSGSVLADHAESSLLYRRIADGEMPPEKNGKQHSLASDDVAKIREWIDKGASWPEGRVLDLFERTNAKRAGRDWWAWQPLRIADEDMPPQAEAIDYFIGKKLVEHQLTAAPASRRRELIRRVYFDLIGLPPSSDEVHAFEASESPDAYGQIVDRLLSSPQFGERWARHWLDLVRYAETNGYERDAVKEGAWRYRDWVVNAFNSDMPYDQFVIEQLAGDEIPDRSEASVIATGFLRLGTWDDEPNDPLEYQYDRLEDMVHATTTAFLGMTVKCARCHDHKFDAIPQTDYYRIAAAFWAGPIAHRQREWNGGPTREELGFDVLGWTDLSRQPPELHLLRKGNPHQPLQAVTPGSLSGSKHVEKLFEPAPTESKTSLRRLQLAKWIVDKQNPLSARVIVNRLWQHHFGEGLVRTPDNFGFLGSLPTHPELLDWLAGELIRGDWKLKRIHKLMVMSKTYQQSSLHPEQSRYATVDSANHYWWRAERRRLESEQLRDAILWCSGRLDLKMGGPSFKAPISDEALEGLSMKAGAYQASPDEETRRRSLYMFAKRSLAVPMMTVFDSCDTTAPIGRRDVSTVAPQALTLLNNRWVHDESEAMARRVMAVSNDTKERIEAAWRIALARQPTTSEQATASEFLHSLGITAEAAKDSEAQQDEVKAWASLCHTLINTNEFIYID